MITFWLCSIFLLVYAAQVHYHIYMFE